MSASGQDRSVMGGRYNVSFHPVDKLRGMLSPPLAPDIDRLGTSPRFSKSPERYRVWTTFVDPFPLTEHPVYQGASSLLIQLTQRIFIVRPVVQGGQAQAEL
jgi:hypothetical protein